MTDDDYAETASGYGRRPSGAGTDAIAFRALEARLRALGATGRALDIGCGAGRSTRFLKALGLEAVGLDVSAAMLAEARRQDPDGAYVEGDAAKNLPFEDGAYDFVLSTWAILELGSPTALARFAGEAGRVLRDDGRLFVVTNTPDFYAHRWVSCDVDFPENRPPLVPGRRVTARLMPEGVQVHDYFWRDQDYRRAFAAAGLVVHYALHPTAPPGDAGWLDETRVAPYVIYEIEKQR